LSGDKRKEAMKHETKIFEQSSGVSIEQEVLNAQHQNIEQTLAQCAEKKARLATKGITLTPEDERGLAFWMADWTRYEQAIFASTLLQARLLYKRFPELVSANTFPSEYVRALEEWRQDLKQESLIPKLEEHLQECAWLLPDGEFESYIRQRAEDMVLDAKEAIAMRKVA
jgi:hypothetical protein